ncbi:MAG: ThuA domain-containing protein [Pirellulales bacterium]|nr:ThuA domain-containing protein [Pirellulales bacterium]
MKKRLSLRCVLASALAATMAGLPGNFASAADGAKKLLIIGDKPDGHPKTMHEFMAGANVLTALLKNIDGLEVAMVNGKEPWPDGPERIRRADGVVIFVSQGAKWAQSDARRYEALAQLAARGGGISALHWGIGAVEGKDIEGDQNRIGGIHGGSDRKHIELEAKLIPVENHPITRGVRPFEIKDEFYYQLKFAQDGKLTPIVQAELDGARETVSWAWERPDGGRSFGFGMLHFHANWNNAAYRRIVAQGVLWTMKLDEPSHEVDVSVDDNVLELR